MQASAPLHQDTRKQDAQQANGGKVFGGVSLRTDLADLQGNIVRKQF